nr:MAG TPA: hypothetical protein [Bacteriophage sp.]
MVRSTSDHRTGGRKPVQVRAEPNLFELCRMQPGLREVNPK